MLSLALPIIVVEDTGIRVFSSEETLRYHTVSQELFDCMIYDCQGNSIRVVIEDVTAKWALRRTHEIRFEVDESDTNSRLEARLEIVRFFILYPQFGLAKEEVFLLDWTSLVKELVARVGIDN